MVLLDQKTKVIAFTLRTAQAQLERWRGQADLLDQQIGEAHDCFLRETTGAELHKAALAILQSLEQKWRGAFEKSLAGVVSEGLTTVFGRPLRIEVETKLVRGVSSSKIILYDGDLKIEDPLKADGGSLVEVMDFLLRILLTLSVRPPLRRLLLLDEPFSHVSAEYRPALCQLLQEMTKRLELQVAPLVSHEPEMADAADLTYLVEKPGGVTLIKRLRGPGEGE